MSDPYGPLNPMLAGRQPSATYNTPLDQLHEMAFRQWLQENNVPFNPDATTPQDYDMRGFYRALREQQPIARSAIDPNDNRMHYPDYFKTPLHETFSNESQFAPEDAPHWNDKDQLVTVGGRILFDDRAKKTNDLVRMLMGQGQ